MTIDDSFRFILRETISELLTEAEERIAARTVALLRETAAAVGGGDRLLTPRQAAALTGYAAETIVRWQRDGKLTRHGTVRGSRVSEAELRRFLAPRRGPELTDDQIMEMARERAFGPRRSDPRRRDMP